MNWAAEELYRQIRATLNIWNRSANAVQVQAQQAQELWFRVGAWYIDFENQRRASRISPHVAANRERVIFGWVRQIDNMFDPPTEREITSPCPECLNEYAHDPKTGNRIRSLVIEYRESGLEAVHSLEKLQKANAFCRFCETAWGGGYGLRELRWLIDHIDPTIVTVAEAVAS